jgi:fido (protein-threonine AMPylation protein)
MDYSESKLPPTYDVAENELPYQIKLALWQTAFGLQKVDGLSPSEYMVELAYENIEGKKGYDAIYREISDYHREAHVDANTVEADIVSLRIAELLAEDHFLLSPSTLLGIHRHLFTDVFPEEIPVGKFRTVNITKKEPVLDGETVQYSSHFMIQDTLAYDFEREQNFSYSWPDQRAKSAACDGIFGGHLASPSFQGRKYPDGRCFRHPIFEKIRIPHRQFTLQRACRLLQELPSCSTIIMARNRINSS